MKKPSIKAKKTMQKILENPGMGVSRAMRESGYSPNTAQNPSDLTNTKSWKDLLDEYFPDDEIKTVIKEGLHADKTISAQVIVKSDDPTIKTVNANSRTMDFIDVPDHPTRHKFVETVLKLKSRYPTEKMILAGDHTEPLEIRFIEEVSNPLPQVTVAPKVSSAVAQSANPPTSNDELMGIGPNMRPPLIPEKEVEFELVEV